ncbi:MAG TPA: MFS transporter [Steroidobacteraceae bacterium]|nr:MFS transporter [Steroidobacteraceae bacterium]
MYRDRAVLSMLFLGFSAGLPFMLVFSTLSAWLRQAGIERATIGMLAWVGIVYSIKFLWAPAVDRVPVPLLTRMLGRRRSWMMVAQFGIALGLMSIAHADPATNVLHIAALALFVAFCAATQDIAIDAWRIESASERMQGGMAAAYQLGYRIAIMVGSAGALWLAADYSWTVAYLSMAGLTSVGVLTTLLTREPTPREGTKSAEAEHRVTAWVAERAHWPDWLRNAGAWFMAAIVGPIADFFTRYGLRLGLLIFAFIGSYRLTDYAMGVMANPFYLDHGYTLKQVAAVVKGFGLIASMVGVVIGGVVVAKLGNTRALVAGSVMVMCSNVGFSILAATDSASIVGLALANSLDNVAIGIHGTALVSFLSNLTSARYTATQYAVLSSLYAMPGKLLMGTSGFVVDAIGYEAFFLYTSSLSVPALILLYFLAKRMPSLKSNVAA